MKNGIQTGILTTTISRTLEIIDATHLRVTVTSQEENGCTVTTPIDYELREASDAVCVDVRVDEPAQTTSTAPTIAPGKYQVAFPVFGADCNADNSPAFTAVDLSFDTSGSMVLAYDGGSYTLFSDGSGFYSYQEMKNGFFSVQVYPLGDYLNLSWSKYGGGRNCFLTGEMRLEGSQSGGLQITEGNYAASWTPDATCDPALKDAAPDFTTASLTRPAGLSIQLDFAGGSYTANQISPGAYSYSQFGADGSGVMLRFTVLSETEMEASFYVSNAGGKFCSGRGQLTLAE